MKNRQDKSERGAVAVMVAGSLVLVFGLAALAVDTSGFYQTARVGQTTADLACLAGVAELPDRDAAVDLAIEYTKANWPGMAGATQSSTGPNSAVLSDANGNVVLYETSYGGDDDAMRIIVTKRDKTTFGQVLGVDTVDIAQEAACARQEQPGGLHGLPIGALPGHFSGDLFDCAVKVTGNCGGLNPDGSGASTWKDQIVNGISATLVKHHGDPGDADPDTGYSVRSCPGSTPCNAVDTEPGNMQGPFSSGFLELLSNTAGADCIIGGTFNCDSLSQVLGSTPTTIGSVFGSAPSWWEPSLYGDYSAAKSQQYYFNGDFDKCDSPRLGSVPIVWAPDKKKDPLDWDIGDGKGTWPNGKGEMKVIGFYSVYIREPDTPGEAGSKIQADVIWFGPDTTCRGADFDPFDSTMTIESVKLITP